MDRWFWVVLGDFIWFQVVLGEEEDILLFILHFAVY